MLGLISGLEHLRKGLLARLRNRNWIESANQHLIKGLY